MSEWVELRYLWSEQGRDCTRVHDRQGRYPIKSNLMQPRIRHEYAGDYPLRDAMYCTPDGT